MAEKTILVTKRETSNRDSQRDALIADLYKLTARCFRMKCCRVSIRVCDRP